MCLTVVAGRQATVDGAVLVGHNEENEGPYFANFRWVHPDDGIARVSEQRRMLDLPKELHRPKFAFFWSQIPGREYSDNYLNEAGVAIVSNGCPSREEALESLIAQGEIRQGGIGGLLRRLVAEHAGTAQEGVELIGQLVEQFGYRDSGRTYVVADPQEAWVVAVVRGRRWLARRVPDEAAVVVPNVFIFDDLPADGNNLEWAGVPRAPSSGQDFSSPVSLPTPGTPSQRAFGRCSRDLVSYAIQRGWYQPDSGKPFSFRQAYQSAERNRPDVRQWWGQQLLLREEPSETWQTSGRDSGADPKDFAALTDPLPWCVRPRRKLRVRDLAAVLRNQQGPRSLFHPATQETAVFELRSWLPPELGCVYWRTVGRPDGSPLLPWYLGVRGAPKEYCHPAFRGDVEIGEPSLPLPEEVFRPCAEFVWWKFQALQQAGEALGEKGLQMVRAVWEEWESQLWASRPSWEEQRLQDWPRDPEGCRTRLAAYCKEQSESACREVERLMERLAEGTSARRLGPCSNYSDMAAAS